MTFWQILTRFDGRIRRKQWWLGFLTLCLASLLGALAFHPEMFKTPIAEPLPPPPFAYTVYQLLLVIPGVALSVKRFNDRDYPIWLGFLVGGISVAFIVAQTYGYLLDPMKFSVAEMIVMGLCLGLLIWVIVDNGFLKGTAGPNRHGPDPRAA